MKNAAFPGLLRIIRLPKSRYACENDHHMKEVLVLRGLDQIKALADPLRLQVLEAFCHKPMTTKQVAVLLEENPTRLYHHVDILEKAGLIRLVETRPNRGTVERYYGGVARKIAVDHVILDGAPGLKGSSDELQKALTSALEATMSEIRRSVEAKLINRDDQERSAMVARMQISTTLEQAEELRGKITDWLGECRKFADKQGEITYGLTVAFYPIKKKQKARSAKGKTKNI